jgi:hypothetical protein
MSSVPLNDLDRALVAVQRGPSAMPQLYRELGEGEIFLLIPWRPDLELGDAFQLKNGMAFPFVRLQDEEGEIVPIFSSEARAQEGLERGKVPPNTMFIVSMPAIQVMEVLGKVGFRAVVNKSCTTPQFTVPPDLMRDIASGKVFEPLPVEHDEIEVALDLLDPADYPTGLVQAAFEVLRKYRNFRAVWIFRSPRGAAVAPSGRGYQFLLLMEPRDDAIYHEFNMVIAAAGSREDDIGHGLVDETDPVYIANLFRQAAPFYVATDFAQPRSQ